jgi:maltose O-acetyltransferase
MTERDKMLRGEPYDSYDPELLAARFEARRLTRKLSDLDPADLAGRDEVLRALLGGIGPGSWVEAPFFCDYGAQISLGARVFVNMACVFLDAAPITLGDDVQLGPACSFSRRIIRGTRRSARAAWSGRTRSRSAPAPGSAAA